MYGLTPDMKWANDSSDVPHFSVESQRVPSAPAGGFSSETGRANNYNSLVFVLDPKTVSTWSSKLWGTTNVKEELVSIH